MFERFTESSRRAILFAQDEARLLEHPRIGTVHVLLGLIHESDGIGGRALASLGLSLVATRAAVVEASDVVLAAAPSLEPIPFADDAKALLELAPREALRLGHRDIGTEHLVLAITSQPRSAAMKVLADLGVECAALRTRVLELLAHPPTPPATTPATRATTSVQLSPETQELLARSARKALKLGVAYASKGSLTMRLLGTAGNAALGMSSTPSPVARPDAIAPAAASLTPAACSFCGTASPECGTLFSGATGALICEHCVKTATS